MPELLRHVHAKALTLFADDDRRHAREQRPRRRQLVEVEVREPPHELLTFDHHPGQRSGRIVGEDTELAEARDDVRRVVRGEEVPAARSQPDERADRVVTVEETFELDLDVRDLVALQCRQPNLEGSGEITLRRLIKEALRMRPDRLIVGEVREAESLDLLIALNSGLPGMCTIHANSTRDALTKLCTLPLLAGRNIDSSFVIPTVASCIDLVVHLTIDRTGARRVAEIAAPSGRCTGASVDADTIFEIRDGALVPTGARPARLQKYLAHGFDPEIVLDEAAR